jgi:hypothetical protein
MIKRNIYYNLIVGQRSLLAISNVGAQHAICNMRLSGIVAPLTLCWPEGLMRANPGCGSPHPKHAVREGLLTLAKGQER